MEKGKGMTAEVRIANFISSQAELRNEAIAQVEEFKRAFNALENQLRLMQKAQSAVRFEQLLGNHKWPNHSDSIPFLQRCGNLRNFYSHGQTQAADIYAVPMEGVVVRLKRITQELQAGPKVGDRMAHPVLTFRPETTLMEALDAIDERQFSQFPIYTDAGRFRDVVTESRITTWLAKERWRIVKTLKFQSVKLGSIISISAPKCYEFVRPDMAIRGAILKFSGNPYTEVLLVTETGNGNSPLLGIFTLWDAKQCIDEGY